MFSICASFVYNVTVSDCRRKFIEPEWPCVRACLCACICHRYMRTWRPLLAKIITFSAANEISDNTNNWNKIRIKNPSSICYMSQVYFYFIRKCLPQKKLAWSNIIFRHFTGTLLASLQAVEGPQDVHARWAYVHFLQSFHSYSPVFLQSNNV